MIKRYGHGIIRWRYFILLATLVLVALTTLGFPLKFDIDYRVFFKKNDPQLLAFEELQNTYTKNDNVMFVLAPQDGQIFTNKTLEAVSFLTDEAWQIPYSSRVDSITNFQHTYAEGDNIFVEDLITDAKTLSKADLERAEKIALQEPLLVNHLISQKAHVTGINITVQLPGEQLDKEVPEVVKFSRDLVDKLRNRYPHLDVYLTGMVMGNNAFPEASKQDMRFLIPIMFLVIIILLWLLLRIFSGLFATLLVILFSTISAMGLAGLMGISLTGPSNAAPIVIFTLAIADGVHLLTTFRHEMWVNGQEKCEAIVESLRINIQPIFLTSLTTAIGFLSMNFGDSPPFRDLGNITAMGIVIAFILSISFLPALIAILPVRSSPPKKTRLEKKLGFSASKMIDRLGEFVVQRRHGLMWSMVGVTLLLIAFLPRNELNDVFLEYYDESVDFRVATDFTTDNLTGLMDIHYSLSASEPEGISNPEFLRKVDDFVQWYYQQPETIHVSTITEIFKRLNKNMHGDDPAYYRLPEQHDLAAQYLLLYEMSLPYGLDLNNQINIDKSATRVTVTLKNLSTNEVLALEKRAQQWLKKNGLPTMQVPGTSSTLMFAHLNYQNIRGMLLGVIIALVLISLILIVALRSVKFGLISLIPNLVPMAMAFGVWGMLVGEVNLGVSAVAGLTIGIVVDDTIHYLSKYLRARREKGLTPPEAVRYAFRNVGIALWITSVVLVAGFLVLTLSHFYGNFTLGMMTAMTITFALITDFFLLPPLLMKLEEK
jgi:predicted RND superfamily exporter protein